jgi:hypothetical protein
MTFVVHAFMDAAVVEEAWRAMEQGTRSDDPHVQAAEERLRACSYAMAHPQDGRIVPACVQHSVLDQQENRQLLTLLPMALATASDAGTTSPGDGKSIADGRLAR